MSVRPRKKIALQISQNKAYQVILNALVTEKSTQQSEFNKMVFSVPVNATKLEVKSSIEKIARSNDWSKSKSSIPLITIFLPSELLFSSFTNSLKSDREMK